jgi:hypothetical protein
MSHGQIIFEVAKLAAQFVGALAIAWLTVRWALTRYKSERTWERKLSAYADAVASITEMQAVVGEWFDEAVEDREATEDQQAFQQQRFQTARRRLDESIAAALLLLPKEAADLLHKLKRDLEATRQANTLEQHLDDQYGILQKARAALIDQGRETLGMRALRSGSPRTVRGSQGT